MRLISWYGLAAILTAAGIGYVVGVEHHPCTDACCPVPAPAHEEESTAPPSGYTFEGLRITPPEEIDLTCPPNLLLPFELFKETNEPPLAGAHHDPQVHRATFEVPAGPPAPPVMPYLD